MFFVVFLFITLQMALAAPQNYDDQPLLVSIEKHLRHLDEIYTLHLTPTLHNKFDQYQRKLEALDIKLIRLESLMLLNLDKISENINVKNFKDDIGKINLSQKIDNGYDSLTHKLSYVDRKLDVQTNKIQAKFDVAINRMDRMEESIKRRDEDIETELSDAIAAVDDLKTFNSVLEQNMNETNRNFNNVFKNHKTLFESQLNTNKILHIIKENATYEMEDVQEKMDKTTDKINEVQQFLVEMASELKSELNEYAIKVGEMSAENWKARNTMEENQEQLLTSVNCTKNQLENGLKTLTALVMKDTRPHHNEGLQLLVKLNDKLNANFEKMFSAQNLFLDSCYRLQSDESQIESKISEVLEKLMETFERKTAVEIRDINNLEKLIKSHDNQMSRGMYQISSNLVTLYDKIGNENKRLVAAIASTNEHVNGVFNLFKNHWVNNDNNYGVNQMMLQSHLQKIEQNFAVFNSKNLELSGAIQEIREIFNSLLINYHSINKKIDKLSTTNIKTPYPEPPEATESATHSSKQIDFLIKQIFGTNPNLNQNYTTSASSIMKCKQNYASLIDIRSGGSTECPPEDDLEMKGNENGTETTENPEIEADNITENLRTPLENYEPLEGTRSQ